MPRREENWRYTEYRDLSFIRITKSAARNRAPLKASSGKPINITTETQQELREGNWGGYGTEIQTLGQILKQMPAKGH